MLDRGKQVFADTCARCHSSKAPKPAAGLDPNGCAGPDYMACWKRYWDWTKTDDYKSQMRAIVSAPDFLDGNYLSTDLRVPVTLLQTNACSPLATNALAGNIWDNFSSQSYKNLPSVGQITVHDPFTGEPQSYDMPAGGRGFTRPPTLISLWSTAPFLLNNSVGPFEQDPSVDARMRVFNASIEQLLWPEKRAHDKVLGDKVPGVIDRTDDAQRDQDTGGVSFPTCCGRRAVRCTTCCRSCSTRTATSRSGRSRPGCRSTCWPICSRSPESGNPVERTAAFRASAPVADPAQARSALAAGERERRGAAREIRQSSRAACWS